MIETISLPSMYHQMYEFLYKSAVCASKCKRSRITETEKDKHNFPAKKKQKIQTSRAFMTSASNPCAACKTKNHPLYLCNAFKQMLVQQRIETVKIAQLCYNCLRSHKNKPCKFSNCSICQKRHNTLLHLEKFAKASTSEKSTDTSKNE